MNNYRVEETQDNVQFYMRPEHLEVFSKSNRFNSLVNGDEPFSELTSAGFDFRLDEKSGELDVKGRSESWQDAIKGDGGALFVKFLKQIGTPKLITTIPAQKGKY